jgi:hypothetical protein
MLYDNLKIEMGNEIKGRIHNFEQLYVVDNIKQKKEDKNKNC